MKIRDRLTLTISSTVTLIVVLMGSVIYMFTAEFHKKEFFKRLEERVQITELFFLEEDSVIQAVKEKFIQKLEGEKEFIFADSQQYALKNYFAGIEPDEIKKNEFYRFFQGKRQGVARAYSVAHGNFIVVVTAEDRFGILKLNFLRKILFFGILISVLIILAVTWISVKKALNPLVQKIHKASAISANRLDLRLNVRKPYDELSELAIAFNRMLDRIQAGFEAQKNFVRNASHEIRNPLTAIIGEVEVLLSRPREADEYREALRIIGIEAERLEHLTTQLLTLSNTESLISLPSVEEISFMPFLKEILNKFPAERLVLHPKDYPQWQLSGNSVLLHAALYNLLDNAFKYSGEKPVVIEINTTGEFLVMKIIDQGIGIPASDMSILYQPMHRASNVRNIKGHGIGLPLAKKIISLHGGCLEIHSREGQGTTVTVILPLAE